MILHFEQFTQYLLKIDLRKFYLLCVVFWNTLVHIVSIWLSNEKYKSDLVYDTSDFFLSFATRLHAELDSTQSSIIHHMLLREITGTCTCNSTSSTLHVNI